MNGFEPYMAGPKPEEMQQLMGERHMMPTDSNWAGPLGPLLREVQKAMMKEIGGAPISTKTAAHLTDVLLCTVSNLSLLRAVLGEHLVAKIVATILGEFRTAHLPTGLLDS